MIWSAESLFILISGRHRVSLELQLQLSLLEILVIFAAIFTCNQKHPLFIHYNLIFRKLRFNLQQQINMFINCLL